MIRISARDLSKNFFLDSAYNDGALAKLLRLFSAPGEKKERHALRHVSFETHAGEIVGLMGRNGSGKTTLLRILAGIYLPDEGQVETKGKAVYLSGFAQGLMPRLTMRENIRLIGALRGLSPKEIKGKLDEIIDFSGLENYMDVKTYQFSSGMVGRLGFSATIHCIEKHNPDILLIDEALGAAGDMDFQDKAMLKLNEFILNRAAVILASHNVGMLQKHCKRALWIENGCLQKDGDSSDVTNSYLLSSKTRAVPIK